MSLRIINFKAVCSKFACSFFICMFLSINIKVNAQAQFSVYGKVLDKSSGETLQGAHILVDNTLKSTITSGNGTFAISGLKNGEYRLIASFIGYISDSIIISHNGAGEIVFRLKPVALLQDEVVINASRADDSNPVSYTNVSKNAISRINLSRDIPYLIENTPSVVVSSDAGTGVGYTNIRIRGTDMNRINITLNGIPLNDAESHGVWWVNMPDIASSVENLQIQRGVGLSTNGAAAFGANINMQTSVFIQEPYAEISNSFGSFNTRKHSIKAGTGQMKNNWSIDTRLSSLSSDGYIDRASSKLESYYISTAWYGQKSILRLNHLSGKEKTYQAWDGIPSEILDTNRTWNGMGAYFDEDGKMHFYDNETDNYKQDHYQCFYSMNPAPGLNFNLIFHYTRGYGYYEQYKDDQSYQQYGLQDVITGNDTLKVSDLIRRKYLDNHFYGSVFSIVYDRLKKIKLNVGGGINEYDGLHYGEIIWFQYAGPHEKNYRWYNGKGLKKDYNLYGRVSFFPTTALLVFTDVQYRGIEYTIGGKDDDLSLLDITKHYNFFNPKAGLTYLLNDKNRFTFFMAIANREPTRSNFTDADPGKEPKAEKLLNMEAGYGLNLPRFNLGLNVYNMNYINQLVLTGEINNVGDPVMTNVASSYRRGVEISCSFKPNNWINWDANTTISENRIRNFVEYTDDWDTWSQRIREVGTTELAFSPSIVASSGIYFTPYNKINIGLVNKFVGRQYIDNTKYAGKRIFPTITTDDIYLKEYFLTNILASYKTKLWMVKEAEFSLYLNNVFNIRYETNAWIYRYYKNNEKKFMNGVFPQAGFNFMAGMKISL